MTSKNKPRNALETIHWLCDVVTGKVKSSDSERVRALETLMGNCGYARPSKREVEAALKVKYVVIKPPELSN